MPLVGTRGGASARAYGFTSGSGPEVLGGMVLVTPTSIASTGTGNSSSINANGSVTFDSCATLSLNGVFTADHDNYMISLRYDEDSGLFLLRGRLRVSGTDSTATTDYNEQYLQASSTTVDGARTTNSGYWGLNFTNTEQRAGLQLFLFGPYLTQPTAYRTVAVGDSSGAAIRDYAGTHELSTAYDGITIFGDSASKITGLVSVYGLVGA